MYELKVSWITLVANIAFKDAMMHSLILFVQNFWKITYTKWIPALTIMGKMSLDPDQSMIDPIQCISVNIAAAIGAIIILINHWTKHSVTQSFN